MKLNCIPPPPICMKSEATVDTEGGRLPCAGKLHEVFDSGCWTSEFVRVCLFSTKTTFRLAEFKRGRWEAEMTVGRT